MRLALNDEHIDVLAAVESELLSAGYIITAKDLARPWGGFFVIDESQGRTKFANEFFGGYVFDKIASVGRISPKILVVKPRSRLSWQYHHRRSEIWNLIAGTAGVVISNTDIPAELQTLALNQIIQIKQGQRHRLVGLERWGVVAEIWSHTDATNLSDEDDIVRLQDDFGR